MYKLPLQCEAYYLENFLTEVESDNLFNELTRNFNMSCQHLTMEDGRVIEIENGAYMFADEDLCSFEALHQAWGERSPWTASLIEVRDRIQQQTGIHFQVGRCIYYKNGQSGCDFHADLPAYGSTDQIASLSLGATRTFHMRETGSQQTCFSLALQQGSLLFMGKGTQQNYEHAIGLESDCTEPRLNITFRQYGY